MVQSRKTPEEAVVPEDTLRLKRIETQLCLMTKVFMDRRRPNPDTGPSGTRTRRES